eukprot:1143487-Pelagomonas_calceolata.AAC.2
MELIQRLQKQGGLQSKRLTASLLKRRKKFIKKRIHFVVVVVVVLNHESRHIKGLYMSRRQVWNRLGRGTG